VTAVVDLAAHRRRRDLRREAHYRRHKLSELATAARVFSLDLLLAAVTEELVEIEEALHG
jgi:hypothetical protein